MENVKARVKVKVKRRRANAAEEDNRSTGCYIVPQHLKEEFALKTEQFVEGQTEQFVEAKTDLDTNDGEECLDDPYGPLDESL